MAATNVSIPGLEKLHEIFLPDPVSWVPRTTGWYAVLGLVLLAAAYWVYRWVRGYRANRYRRSALAALKGIEQKLQRTTNRAAALAEIPALLKWTALSAYSRSDVACLSGEKWLAFLDKTMGGNDFRQGEGRLLADLAYVPASQTSPLPDATIGAFLRLVRHWICTHAPIQP